MRMKVLSPIVASLLLIIIVASVATILYFVMISMSIPNEESIELVDAKLVKQYSNIYAHIVLYNNGRTSIRVKMVLHGETSIFSSEYSVIAPGDISRIYIVGSYGYDFIVGEDYVIEIVGDINFSVIVKCSGFELIHKPMYIFAPTILLQDFAQLNLSKKGSIENVSEVVNGILEASRKLGIVVKTISSMDEWLELVLNPRDDVIIINPFGGLIPVPREYFNDTEKVLEFIELLHNNIRDYGWIWVHLSGYPLYYAVCDDDIIEIGIEGFEYLLFGSRGRGTAIVGSSIQEYDDVENRTSDIVNFKSWLNTYGFNNISRKLVDNMRITYSVFLKKRGIESMVVTKFYTDRSETRSGACILRIGKGLYIHWGSPTDPPFSDKELGTLGLLLAVYSTMYLR
ncbi:hypothetical protein J4526_07520 [Desulfurococcaceae archaeon MEX13E-LK6-19]|nr:hypothetical protein J4526_07520 [Desulfurococcaceae archaeon MEX13E-LK6-19]